MSKQGAIGPIVEDIYGDQVKVGGHWYHAERVFRRPVGTFALGAPVPELEQNTAKSKHEPDAIVDVGLFRESGANVTDPSKVDQYLDAMHGYGGWGEFPPVSGRVLTVDQSDLDRYIELEKLGCAHELSWSRPLKMEDVGRQYVHLAEGHHRLHAAALYKQEGGAISAPVFDLGAEELRDSRYISHERSHAVVDSDAARANERLPQVQAGRSTRRKAG